MAIVRAVSLAIFATVVLCVMSMQPDMAVAQSASCQQSCRAQHSQCRISTQGSSSCDAALHSCLQSCVPKR